ncbi:uncharacterized protein METZ01_LOCUS270815, partial [marine metagenome]
IVTGTERSQNMRSVIDYSPFLRACLLNLDAWVTQGVEPPYSKHPRIKEGTLVSPSELSRVFSQIRGANYPKRHAIPRRRGFLPEDGTEHPEILPPEVGEAYGGLVPAVNSDGNETAGIIAPEIAVPLATHTGWTLRHPDIGGESQLLMFAGGTIPFCSTEHERREVGDHRPSIEERYSDRRDYLDKVRVEAEELVEQHYLLKRDIDISLELASRMWDYFVSGKTQE